MVDKLGWAAAVYLLMMGGIVCCIIHVTSPIAALELERQRQNALHNQDSLQLADAQ